jgi:PAS domain S-box-containing protein
MAEPGARLDHGGGDLPRGPMEKQLRILMIEANPADARVIEGELGKAGIQFTARRVETQPEFESELRGFSPHIILSDYWLPSFDGPTALAITKQESPEIPFIFVSSALGEELAIDTIRDGASDYVLKVGLSRLLPAVQRALSDAIDRDERRHAETRLRESEGRLKTIVGSVGTGVMIIDPVTHRIVDANPSATEMFGFPREELIGQVCHNLVCPAKEGACPITDLGEVLNKSESPLRTASGENLTVLKTVTRVIIDEREHLLESLVDITDSKKMEEALRESEETSRMLLNVPFSSASMVDAEFNLLAINETGAERLGKSVEELIGTNIIEQYDKKFAETRRRQLQQVFNTGEILRFEDEHEGVFLDVNLFPITDSSGKVSRVVLLAMDVTERKRVEEAQVKDRDFIQKVLNTADALVLVRERQGRIVLFNRKAEEITGYRFHEMAGNRIWDVFLDTKGAKQSRANFKKLLAGEEAEEYEAYWKTKTGDRRLILLSNATLIGADDNVEYVITTGIDITESRRAEEKLKESEERYRTVFESSGTAMCIVDRDARIIFLNHEFERTTGYKAREVVGKKRFTDFLPGEGATSFRSYLRDIQRAKAESPIHFECELVAKDGYVLNMMANVGFMPGVDTNAVSLIDVTREKAYEEDLRERAERLRDFLVVASHELRHPITIVKGYSHILAEHIDTMPPEQVQEILQDITMSTDRLTRYVEQLLDISRIEQGKVVMERQPVDVGHLVDTALEDMAMIGTGNQFIKRVEVGEDKVALDPEKFVQLLNILLDNAVKFSPEGSPVEIDMERDGEMLVVSVLDRGNGIPEDSREKIFSRFYQVEDAAHHSKVGLGLGLYIARQFTQAHDGNIWVEPRMGGGSIFRFTIFVGRGNGEQDSSPAPA